MTNYEIQQHIDSLYRDLDNVKNMDEATACRVYNVDYKAEIIEVIQDEIDTCKAIMPGAYTHLDVYKRQR